MILETVDIARSNLHVLLRTRLLNWRSKSLKIWVWRATGELLDAVLQASLASFLPGPRQDRSRLLTWSDFEAQLGANWGLDGLSFVQDDHLGFIFEAILAHFSRLALGRRVLF